MHKDGACHQEPYNHFEYFSLLTGVRTLVAVVYHRAEELSAGVQIEDGTDTNGTEKAHEAGVSHLIDLMNSFVEGEDHRKASEEEHKYAQGDQAIDWDDIVVNEHVPWTDSTIPRTELVLVWTIVQ